MVICISEHGEKYEFDTTGINSILEYRGQAEHIADEYFREYDCKDIVKLGVIDFDNNESIIFVFEIQRLITCTEY